MNKDVIYIEPEDDITDILVNIKHAKNKIIALVPPKKAGVLHSAVNFKLIAKTAAQRGKTVVLISSDDSLLRLAEKVKMPTAKSLQSKPHLPEMDDAEEFGEGDDDDEEEAEKEKTEKAKEDDAEAEAEEEPKKGKEAVKKSEDDAEKEDDKKTASKAAVAAAGAKKRPDIDMEIDGDKDDDEEEDDKKSKKKKMVVPNFKKWRWPILLGVILIAAIIGISYWATNIAPAARITVTVKTTAANFNETVTFVTDETKSDPEKGIFFAQQKTIIKQASDDFEATGEVDKGTKATGKITVKVKSPITIKAGATSATFTVPAGTVFTNSAGNKYIASAAATITVGSNAINISSCHRISLESESCELKSDAKVEADVPLVAEANGEKYNFAAASTGWSFPINSITAVKSSDISGGTSKIVKIVSQADIDKAAINMASDIDSQAREELSAQFGNDFLLISSSFATESSKITTSPAVNEEVTTGVTPKIIKENKYIITAVDKKEVDTYIKKIASDKLGDNTQMIYSTGVAMADGEENKAFFESFKNDNGALSAKLKSTTKSGPRITVEQVMQDSLGKKVGVANSKLRSTKGVQEVKIETSYFFVTTIPEDENKVQIEITVEN